LADFLVMKYIDGYVNVPKVGGLCQHFGGSFLW
ncbi:unnamed protein product, partial [marine sediment metagenome]